MRMKSTTCLFLCVLFFSALTPFAHAEDKVPAGFAPSSIWISKTALTAGETATLFTVLYNSSDTSVTADVVFSVDSVSVGTKQATISSGSSQIVSQTWTAVTGSHTISAHIEHASLANDVTGNITVVVAAPPPPSALAEAKDTAVSAVPIIQNVVHAVYTDTEKARESGVKALTDALAKSGTTGKVLGTSTSRLPAAASAAGGMGSFFSSVWHGFLSILLYIFSSQVLFYLLLLFVLFMLYKLMRIMFSDRKHRRS